MAAREPAVGACRAGGIDGDWRDHCGGSGGACPPTKQRAAIIIILQHYSRAAMLADETVKSLVFLA